MPTIGPTRPPLRPIVVGIPDPPPRPEPCPDCPDCPPGGNCEISGFFWYGMLDDNFNGEEVGWASATAGSGDEWDYIPVEQGEEYEADPWERSDAGVCYEINAVHAGSLRGYCSEMGPITWEVTWTPEEPGSTYHPTVLIVDGTVVVRLDEDFDFSGTGVLVVTAIVNGESYGPATLTVQSCG